MAIKLGKEAAFKGETFSDMIAPLKEYATAYKEVEANYDTLAMETEKIRQMMANEDPNSQAHQTYQDYYNRLNDAVTDFARGMNIRNRSALSGLKRGYAQNIIPINNALTLKRSLVDAQDKGRAADPSVIYRKDANNYSLDELIANPTQGVGDAVSGKNIFQNAAHMAANLAKELRNEKMEELFPYTYRYLQQYGWSSDAVHKVLREGVNGENPLGYIINQAVNSTGVQNWNDHDALAKALGWASMGAWDAIGKTDTDKMVDTYNLQKKLWEDQHPKQGNVEAAGPFLQNIKQSYIYTPQQEGALAKIRKWIDEGYIEINDKGEIAVTDKGNSYFTRTYRPSQFNNITYALPSVYSSFPQYNTDERTPQEILNGFINAANITAEDLSPNVLWYDTNRKSQWYVNITDTDTQKSIKTAILNAVRNKDPYLAEYDRDGGKFKRGKTTDILKDEDSVVTGVTLSPYGHYLMVKDKSNKMHNILLETSMDRNNIGYIDEVMKEIPNTVSQYNADGATDATRAAAQAAFDNSIQAAFQKFFRSMSGAKTSDVRYPAGQQDQYYRNEP